MKILDFIRKIMLRQPAEIPSIKKQHIEISCLNCKHIVFAKRHLDAVSRAGERISWDTREQWCAKEKFKIYAHEGKYRYAYSTLQPTKITTDLDMDRKQYEYTLSEHANLCRNYEIE